MYYQECTADYALEVIKEITENAENARRALALIESFLLNMMSVEEIQGRC